MTPDREKVVERLRRVSYYFKSLLAVGWQGDADTYREHRESVNMAIALLKEQEPEKVLSMEHDPLDPGYYDLIGNCPGCNAHIEQLTNRHYCGYCGKGLIWDDKG